jgi:N-acetylmuramoyl-L-alanine amidase
VRRLASEVRSGAAHAGIVVLATLVGLGAAAPRIRAASSHPDRTLYGQAQAAETRLRHSRTLLRSREAWERVVLDYRKVVARFPRSGYCDNALLAVGTLYREMGDRFQSTRYYSDAASAYRLLVAEYPSSHLGDEALWAVVAIARDTGDRADLAQAAEAYLDTFPRGHHASSVKKLMRQKSAARVPPPPPPGLAGVYDLRFWSGENSTRVVLDLERKVELQSDRVDDPERLWIDLHGARLHPNLARRLFPVGDGLLERIRIAQNRPDVVRVVLDFKDSWQDKVFYLDAPPRLVIDVIGGHAEAQTAHANGSSSNPAGVSDASPGSPGANAPDGQPSPAVAAGPGAPASSVREAAAHAASPAAEKASPLSDPTGAPPRSLPLPPPEPPAANRGGSYSLARQLGLSARTIVIDPGHGGHDPGTIGPHGLQEKDLVLDVALRLERLVRRELGADVVMTRSTDVFIPLEERTAIANTKNADLFLSIHANASRDRSARGIETYFLNFARSRHAEAVAARENAISEATLKDLQELVKAITLNSKIDESRDFAASVQEAMVSGVRRHNAVPDRGVHTAPFYVLIGANMPAILAEIAFVSNPEDERRLRTPEYREILARSLLGGVRTYLDALNRTQTRQLTDSRRRSTVAEGGPVR